MASLRAPENATSASHERLSGLRAGCGQPTQPQQQQLDTCCSCAIRAIPVRDQIVFSSGPLHPLPLAFDPLAHTAHDFHDDASQAISSTHVNGSRRRILQSFLSVSASNGLFRSLCVAMNNGLHRHPLTAVRWDSATVRAFAPPYAPAYPRPAGENLLRSSHASAILHCTIHFRFCACDPLVVRAAHSGRRS